MSNLAESITHNTWFIVLTSVAIILMVVSLILPPCGVIDPSVLTAVGELFAFAALGVVIKAIDKGTDAKVVHGNTTIEIVNDEK